MEQSVLFTPVSVLFKGLIGLERRSPRRAPVQIKGSSDFTLEGTITQVLQSQLMIAGQSVVLSEKTWIVGEPQIGAQATVRGVISDADIRVANKIVIKGFGR